MDFNRQPKIGDDVEFTIIPDVNSPVRHSAIRIKYLAPGFVQFEIPMSRSVQGVIAREPSAPWVTQEALAGLLPSLATLGLPPNITERLLQGISSSNADLAQSQFNSAAAEHGEPGIISYQLNGIQGWQLETIPFQWKDCLDYKDIKVGNTVSGSILVFLIFTFMHYRLHGDVKI